VNVQQQQVDVMQAYESERLDAVACGDDGAVVAL
jgi:hypothetical protein